MTELVPLPESGAPQGSVETDNRLVRSGPLPWNNPGMFGVHYEAHGILAQKLRGAHQTSKASTTRLYRANIWYRL